MSTKKLVAIALIAVLAVGLVYFSVNQVGILILEIGYTTFPIIVDGKLQDVDFDFRVGRHFSTVPSYQLMSRYSVLTEQNKLSIFDLQLNFTLRADVYREPDNETLENRTLWRSFNFVFSTVHERKVHIYVEKPANATIGNKATIALDARLVAWYETEAPFIDKTIHREFTIDIPG